MSVLTENRDSNPRNLCRNLLRSLPLDLGLDHRRRTPKQIDDTRLLREARDLLLIAMGKLVWLKDLRPRRVLRSIRI